MHRDLKPEVEHIPKYFFFIRALNHCWKVAFMKNYWGHCGCSRVSLLPVFLTGNETYRVTLLEFVQVDQVGSSLLAVSGLGENRQICSMQAAFCLNGNCSDQVKVHYCGKLVPILDAKL